MIADSLKYIDAHAHLQHAKLEDGRGALIQRLKEKQIGVITVGTHQESSQEAAELAQNFPHVWAIVGIHPYEAGTAFAQGDFAEVIQKDGVVGVGECGLDYYHTQDNKKEQKELFKKQIMFAQEHEMPLMLHCRPSENSMDAYEDALDMIDAHHNGEKEDIGNVHFFAGNKAIAEAFLDRGFTISFTGIVTHDRSLDDVIAGVAEDKYLIETDSPYAAPKPHRGKVNLPEYVPFIASAIAEVRGESEESVRVRALKNAARIYDLF